MDFLIQKSENQHRALLKRSDFVHNYIDCCIFCYDSDLMVGGIRGDFKKSTRPINLVDANRHVSKIQHADFVLNTPFSIIRTFNKKTFKKVPYDFQQQLLIV